MRGCSELTSAVLIVSHICRRAPREHMRNARELVFSTWEYTFEIGAPGRPARRVFLVFLAELPL